ncbi:uncharacterized protein L3040_007646 [Drepanopeziza brunnea f. sp. 'multigermtubi']|uniref:uncharacterized protein n=1 Tax=Drepanopeziza brunnea f. sp. 'multigermtubi' TaxID=698441 RepID=UPI002392793D|nr:hypothetical protein L3040_007646 [Drepanopeziza brunnea f. sp. 'multigermtubi']
MAVPQDMTLRTLNGKFTVNRTYSDSLDKLMALQGFPYLIRMAARTASLTLSLTSIPVSDSPSGPSKIKIETAISAAGMSVGKGKVEERSIDGVPWEDVDGNMGPIVGRAWWCPVSDISLNFVVDPDATALPSSPELSFLRGFDGKDTGDKDLKDSKWCLKEGGEGVQAGDEIVRYQIEAKKSGAFSDHSWGFETGFGEGDEKKQRRYTRRVLARKGGKFEMARMVYDYLGPI